MIFCMHHSVRPEKISNTDLWTRFPTLIFRPTSKTQSWTKLSAIKIQIGLIGPLNAELKARRQTWSKLKSADGTDVDGRKWWSAINHHRKEMFLEVGLLFSILINNTASCIHPQLHMTSTSTSQELVCGVQGACVRAMRAKKIYIPWTHARGLSTTTHAKRAFSIRNSNPFVTSTKKFTSVLKKWG